MQEKTLLEHTAEITRLKEKQTELLFKLAALEGLALRGDGENSDQGRKIADLVEKFKVFVSRNEVLINSLEDRVVKLEGTVKANADEQGKHHREFMLLKGTLEGQRVAEATGRHRLAEVRAEIDRTTPMGEDSAIKAFMSKNGPMMGLIAIVTTLVHLVVYLVERLVP